MVNKVLAELEFASILNEAYAQTQTGLELINKYKGYLMNKEASYALVNNFIKEAQLCRYDNGVNDILESVADYIQSNKTLWALASTCESLNNSNNSYNYLNKNAVKHVEKILEMNEDDAVKYIKAGALKNVMYCEGFRNIVKQVYKDQPMIESTAEYTKATPVSFVENGGDGYYFEIAGNLYKYDDDNNVQECSWNEVSNDFKTITNIMESNNCMVSADTITIKAPNATYDISEANTVIKHGKEGNVKMTLQELRENNRLVLMTTNPRHKTHLGGILEGIALVCENYDNIVNMDNASIYYTKNDAFVVIESGDNLYATLIKSNKHPKWTINENAVEALSFIKTKTNVSLEDVYETQINNTIANVSEQEQQKMQEDIKNDTKQNYRERIEALTEKFKNDPVKLAVLSKLAQQVAE